LTRPLLSVVSPVYNEAECVEELCRQLKGVLGRITSDFEIVLVDDGSRDASWRIIRGLSDADARIRGLKFSRNFGHHFAITAGLDHAEGDWVVVMDSDLQDSPQAIPELLRKAQDGYDLVIATRENRQFGWVKNFSAKMFYCTFRFLTDSDYDGAGGVFRIMSRDMVLSFRRLPEVDRFFPALIDWLGYRRAAITVTHGERYAGETKYPFRKQLQLALNAMLSFSEKPIKLAIYLGLTFAVLAILYGISIVIRALLGGVVVLGYASTVAAIVFMGGINMTILGMVGLYIGRIFRQVKGRPLYLISEVSTPMQSLTNLKRGMSPEEIHS